MTMMKSLKFPTYGFVPGQYGHSQNIPWTLLSCNFVHNRKCTFTSRTYIIILLLL